MVVRLVEPGANVRKRRNPVNLPRMLAIRVLSPSGSAGCYSALSLGMRVLPHTKATNVTACLHLRCVLRQPRLLFQARLVNPAQCTQGTVPMLGVAPPVNSTVGPRIDPSSTASARPQSAPPAQTATPPKVRKPMHIYDTHIHLKVISI
jgi:hypothetical protein